MLPVYTKRMRFSQYCLSLVAVACIAFGLSSCNKSTAPAGTLLLNASAEPSYLNPILSTDAASSSINGFVFSGLLRINSDLEFVPDLAESYHVNDTNTVYTFKLRKGVSWHDGAPFTAEDVAFTFEKILDPNTNTVRRGSYIIDGSPIKVRVLDSHRVQITLPKPFAPFLASMGMGIIPKHLFENEDINRTDLNRNPVGTGPFIFEEWATSQYVKLRKNPDFYRGTPKLEKVLLKIIPDERTALIALEKEELDMASIPYKDVPKFKKDKSIRVYQYEDLLYTYMGFNLKHPFFRSLDVREAIAHAINKPAMIQGILKGFGSVANMPVSPVSWAYPNPAFPGLDYDPEKSKELLAKAGFTLNPDTQILEKDGKPFSFTLLTNQGNKDREKAAQLIQRYLKNVGIDMKIQLMEWSSFIKIINGPEDPKPFDAVILGWSLGIDPDGYSLWHSSQYPNGFNFVGYSNPLVDKRVVEGRLTLDTQKRAEIYKDLYTQIAKDLPYVFLFYPEVVTGVTQRIQGLSDPGPAGLMNPIEAVYIQD